MKKLVLFFLFSTAFYQIGTAQIANDCDILIPICGNGNVSGVINGPGNQDFPGNSSGCLNTAEIQSAWFQVKVFSGTTLGFDIIPNNPSDDYDFAVYGPNVECTGLGQPLRCSFSPTAGVTGVGGNETVTTNTSEDAVIGNADDGTDPNHVFWIDVVAGDEFIVLVNNFSNNNQGFTISWESQDDMTVLDCSIVVGGLGEDQELCVGEVVTLDGTTDDATDYEWFVDTTPFNGTDDFVVLSGETNPTLTITNSVTGIYRVIASNATSDAMDEVLIEFVDPPAVIAGAMLGACPNGSMASFDLSQLNPDVTTETGVTITYHDTLSDANNDVSPLTSPFVSGERTIFARVENTRLGCFSTTEAELIFLTLPTVTAGGELEECGDTTASFDISQLDSQVTSESGLTITYHPTETDANINANPISSPFDTPSTTIWARVENADGCFQVISAELIVINSPTVTLNDFFECELAPDEANFDLDAYLSDLQSNFPGVDFSIHESQMDAENDINPLTGIFTNASNPQTLWVAFEDPAIPQCGDVGSFDLIVQQEPGFNAIPDQEVCDTDGDGDGMFNFDDILLLIRSNPSDIVTFHPSDQDAIDGTNPLTGTHETTSNPEPIWVMVESTAGCRLNVPYTFNLVTLAIPNVNPMLTLEQCSGTATADFDLSVLETQITSDSDIVDFSFHNSLIDAENNVNPISSPFTSTSTTIWARTENIAGCFAISEIDLVVTNSPNITLADFEVCDDDFDQIASFDIDVYTADLLATFPNLLFTIHPTEMDAELGNNEITGLIMNMTNPEVLWASVVDPVAPECNGVFPFNLVVNPLPGIAPGPFQQFSCDLDGSNIGEFDLADTNGEIDPSSSYSISYHPTLADAEANMNPLPNTSFTTGPTTIFARVETTSGCFVTTSIDLLVTPLPDINPAFESGCFQEADGIFDIDALIPTITGGANDVTVTFHRTEQNAMSGVDPLPSPFNTGQSILNSTIFTRVQSDVTGCFITSFVDLEIIVAPDTNASALENCEIDQSDMAMFDLDDLNSQISSDTGGAVTLHSTEADAEAQINPLSGSISSFGESVWANIQVANIPGCDGIREIQLVVNQAPPTDNQIVQNCLLADDPNQFTFDFTTLDNNFTYTVHSTFADANSGNSPVSFPINTTSDAEQFFLRSVNPSTGCHAVSTFDLFVVDFVDNPLETMVICFGETFELPDGRRIINDGQFTVRNLENCTNDIFDLDFQVCNPEEFCQPLMPTGFTPGSTTGQNDSFELLTPFGCTLEIERVEIFNRWGEKVFEGFGNDFSWDGVFNGQPAQQGLYLWSIEYVFFDDQGNTGEQSRGGSIFLVR